MHRCARSSPTRASLCGYHPGANANSVAGTFAIRNVTPQCGPRIGAYLEARAFRNDPDLRTGGRAHTVLGAQLA